MCVSVGVRTYYFILQAANVIVLHRVSFPWQGSLGMRLVPYHWSAIPFPRAKLLLIAGGILPHQTTGGGGREGGEGDTHITETPK